MTWQFEKHEWAVGGIGWHLNLPSIVAPNAALDDNGSLVTNGQYLLTLGDGTKHATVSSRVQITFPNDLCTSCNGTGNEDRNLYVNSIAVNGTVIQPNDPSVSYDVPSCNGTVNNVGTLLCNGNMVVTVPGIVNSISVNAFGSPAMGVYPEMQVNVNGVVQGDWFVNGGNVSYVVSSLSDTHFYFADHLGTVSLIVNANGSIESKSEFDPYGVEVDGNGWDANHYKFTGKERDIESGLDYFGARYYGSTMGRFLSPDWADKPEAVPYSDLSDPQSLNLYGYVRNNPLKTVDSDGHDGEDACCDLGPAIEEINAVAKPLITSAVGALEEGTTLTLGSLGAGAALMLSTKSTNDPTEDAWVNSKGQKSDTVPSDGGVRSSTNDLFENTLENRLRRSQGKPPIGRDGHPLELHSPDQTHTDQSVTMTRTDHRLGDNFKKNHANTGQNPSRIDRNKVNAARRRFWKKHPDEIPPPPKP